MPKKDQVLIRIVNEAKQRLATKGINFQSPPPGFKIEDYESIEANKILHTIQTGENRFRIIPASADEELINIGSHSVPNHQTCHWYILKRKGQSRIAISLIMQDLDVKHAALEALGSIPDYLCAEYGDMAIPEDLLLKQFQFKVVGDQLGELGIFYGASFIDALREACAHFYVGRVLASYKFKPGNVVELYEEAKDSDGQVLIGKLICSGGFTFTENGDLGNVASTDTGGSAEASGSTAPTND
jgi:hypothetical protein